MTKPIRRPGEKGLGAGGGGREAIATRKEGEEGGIKDRGLSLGWWAEEWTHFPISYGRGRGGGEGGTSCNIHQPLPLSTPPSGHGGVEDELGRSSPEGQAQATTYKVDSFGFRWVFDSGRLAPLSLRQAILLCAPHPHPQLYPSSYLFVYCFHISTSIRWIPSASLTSKRQTMVIKVLPLMTNNN